MATLIYAIEKATGKEIIVKDYGEHFHPRYWSKIRGYDKNELKLKKVM
jgi:hypothetical protein